MNADDRKHLTELRSTHLKRLRVLELLAAKQGAETPPSIRIEMEELGETIAGIDQKLIESQQKTAMQKNPVAQVELVFRGNFDSFTPEMRDTTIRVLAAIMEIPTDQITVVRISAGSVILVLEVPKEAAELLRNLYLNQDMLLLDLKIEGVRIVSQSDEGYIIKSESDVKDKLAPTLPQVSAQPSLWSRALAGASFMLVGAIIILIFIAAMSYFNPSWQQQLITVVLVSILIIAGLGVVGLVSGDAVGGALQELVGRILGRDKGQMKPPRN